MNRDDLNQLLNALIPYAQQMLNQQGQFVPFACAISAAGEVEMIGGQPGSDETTTQEIHDVLLKELQQGARGGKYRAVGLCSDVRVRCGEAPEPSEAISVGLEHSDGTAIDVYLPYTKQGAGQVKYGDLFGSARQLRIFSPPAT